ncbi:MAG TPA: hypothetical protein DDZ05_01070 [Candidatus Blackburnbacteria bacterium]|nr:hypothetical protein [Candidatus Blackburnbacteria bacterium]
MKKVLGIILLLLILVVILGLGFLGFVPGLSTLLGANKPKNLGITYTSADLASCRSKSQIEYAVLPPTSIPSQSREFIGERTVQAEFSSKEITATLNNQPWQYWPYKDVQIKFNADGTGEISGVLVKSKVPGYAAAIGIPSQAADFAMKYLPADPVFYVKMNAALTNNKVTTFEPLAFEIGKIPMPLSLFLSFGGPQLIKEAYAAGLDDMTQELSKLQDKRSLIINYINDRLSLDFGKFYAKKAYFGDNKLVFDGVLSEKVSYSP